MSEVPPQDAAEFARRHAGELEPGLTPEQRALLGRIIARRIERGAKLEAIARAVAHGIPTLEARRAMRLGHDETVRAMSWEQLQRLRAQGESRASVRPAADACAACRAAGGVYAIDAVPPIPIHGCTHALGCRCMYAPAPAGATPGAPAGEPTMERSEDQNTQGREPSRPWYRPRPPRPHGPRWTEEQRNAARHQRPHGPSGAQRGPGAGRGTRRRPPLRRDERE